MDIKYIDVDKLRAEIKVIQNSLEHRDVRFDQIKQIRTDCMVEFCKMLNNVIDSLQQEQPKIEDWVDKRKQECMCRRLSVNGNYQCERYEGSFGPCDGRCSWIVDYPKLKELEERKHLEMDLEKEIHKKVLELHTAPCYDELASFARHFYKLGKIVNEYGQDSKNMSRN